jgi:hypothetical protein
MPWISVADTARRGFTSVSNWSVGAFEGSARTTAISTIRS